MGAPQTLPANFSDWDKPSGQPPATLPANFSQWDDAGQAKTAEPQIAPVSKTTNPKLLAAMSGANMPSSVGTAIIGAGGLMAGAALGTAAKPAAQMLAKQYVQHPVLGPLIASHVIGKLREIPGIGHYIPPAAEMIPWIIGRGSGAAGEAAEAEGAASQAEAAESKLATPKPGTPTETGVSSAGTQPTPKGQVPPSTAKAPVSSQSPITPAKVESQLQEALGGKPLAKNVPLRQQVPPSKPTTLADLPKAPAGFTATDSSILKAYKYNPEANELETITNNGGHYVYGDVRPEQMQALEAAKSKGQAWNAIRSQSPLVAKVLNGKRISVKPVSSSSSEDLTPILQKSLDAARAKKSLSSLP